MPFTTTSKQLRLGFNQARNITRQHAKTFYFASHALPLAKRKAAYAIYSICRVSDDSVDQPLLDSQTSLSLVRDQIDRSYAALELDDPLLLAFRKTILQYRIPKVYFNELLNGMAMDLKQTRYATFNELYTYCYRVAGVVGLTMLNVFGFTTPQAAKYAVKIGVAMQLTNIIRDVKEDFIRGRIFSSKILLQSPS